MPCGWGVKAGMVRVWVAGKTVWSLYYTRAISERFRDQVLHYKALYKFTFFALFFYKYICPQFLSIFIVYDVWVDVHYLYTVPAFEPSTSFRSHDIPYQSCKMYLFLQHWSVIQAEYGLWICMDLSPAALLPMEPCFRLGAHFWMNSGQKYWLILSSKCLEFHLIHVQP